MNNSFIATQDAFAKRERRYVLMRLARLSGLALWPIGMLTWLYGVALVLGFLCREGESPLMLLIGPVLFVIGVAAVFLSLGMMMPYQLESRAAEMNATRCSHCGGELINPTGILPKCINPKCHHLLALRVNVVIARIVSSLLTGFNILMLLIGALFCIF